MVASVMRMYEDYPLTALVLTVLSVAAAVIVALLALKLARFFLKLAAIALILFAFFALGVLVADKVELATLFIDDPQIHHPPPEQQQTPR